MKITKITTMSRATCRTNGCNNTPDDNGGIYCLMCKAQQGM